MGPDARRDVARLRAVLRGSGWAVIFDPWRQLFVAVRGHRPVITARTPDQLLRRIYAEQYPPPPARPPPGGRRGRGDAGRHAGLDGGSPPPACRPVAPQPTCRAGPAVLNGHLHPSW